MNSIAEILDLEDADVIITNTSIEGMTKTITLETPPSIHFCPTCGYRMHSRGIKTRNISHPIMQDNYHLVLILKQRRWRCTNPDCKFEINESFNFVGKNRRTTNAADMLIINAFRDLSSSAVAIANRFHVSDTHVLDVFDRYVKMDRLPLTDIISVDEVYLNMDENSKYALVIQDFYTGNPIDLLQSRRVNVTEPYFAAIPKEERFAVKYLISDMYAPYVNYVDKYFPNAVPVVDAFHVIQWLVHAIDMYIRQLLKKYKTRDRKREEELNCQRGYPVHLPISDEVYLLSRYRWLVLANQKSLTYHLDPRMDSHFHRFMNTYDYEYELFKIDKNLETYRDLKEKYITFNTRNAGNPEAARREITPLIEYYKHTGIPMFVNFAQTLERFKEPIINSFIMVEKYGPGGIYDSRLSNGPIESLNRKIKDLKRLGRGYRNFEHFRTRFLFATRQNPTINGTHRTEYDSYYDDLEDFE